MKKVIISSNISCLEALLERSQDKYLYVSAGIDSAGTEDFLKQNKCEKIDIHEGLDGLDFNRAYIDFIGGLNCCYNSIYWLSNSISCKGVFVSDLHREIYNYYCIASLIKKHDCNLLIISDNGTLNKCIRKYCRLNNVDCRILGKIKTTGFLKHTKRFLSSNLHFVCSGWKRKALAYLLLSKKIKSAFKKDMPYCIIKSWIERRSFRQEDKYSDVFFGRLPEYLKDKNREFIILGGILNNYKELLGKIKNTQHVLIIPNEYFIGYFDYLKTAVLNFINRPKIEGPVMFCSLDVTGVLTDCLNKDYENNEVNKNLIHYYYIKGLLKNINAAVFIFTFENQAWEKISVSALRRYSPSTRIIGYAHSSIRPSMLGYFCSRQEEAVMPSPDKIITIGREPKLILQMMGNYKDSGRIRVCEGCALRYEYLFKKNQISRNRQGKILAALSIDMYRSMRLLRFLCDSLGGSDKYGVILRSHPFTPVESIMEKFNIKIEDNFVISNSLGLQKDMQGASSIVYIDTTSSIEALFCGIPAVYVDFREPASPDPLFKLNKLKWIVSDKAAFIDVLEHIYDMDEEQYRRDYNDAVRYLKGYFYPAEEKYLREFII